MKKLQILSVNYDGKYKVIFVDDEDDRYIYGYDLSTLTEDNLKKIFEMKTNKISYDLTEINKKYLRKFEKEKFNVVGNKK